MDILSNLASLIGAGRSKISVPGLGTFKTMTVSGKYDIGSHAFLPPSRRVSFEPIDFSEDDLSGYVAQRYDIPLETAEHYVSKFATELLDQLNRGIDVAIPGIGSLKKEGERVNFAENLLNHSVITAYGLPNLSEQVFTKNEISREQTPVQVKEEPLPDKPYSLDSESVEPNPPAHGQFWNFKPDADQENDLKEEDQLSEPERGKVNYLKLVIILIILLIAGAAAYFYLYKDNFVNYFEEVKNAKVTETNSQQSSVEARPKNDTTIKAVVPVIADTLNADTVSIVPEELAPQTTWEVIGASVINQKEADLFIAQMKKIGIEAKIIPAAPGRRRIKISVATFQDEQSARAGRRKLVVKLKNPELYIFQNKHKDKPE